MNATHSLFGNDSISLALALELDMEMEFMFSAQKEPGDSEMAFVNAIGAEIKQGRRHNKVSVERIARESFGITNQNKVKELTELAIVLEARRIAHDRNLSIRERYEAITQLYKSQVNLSHRTSLSVILQQYSTAAPISYLAGLWVISHNKDACYFEPSAGNGLLCHALPVSQTHVNEVDPVRLQNLRRQPFKTITSLDASMPFEYGKIYDGILTNPPFGDLPKVEIVDGFHIKKLEHLMAIYALQTMKDDGRAAIIVGGHTRYDSASGVITNKGDRYFLNYLSHFYKVDDIIPIDGQKLYSRQGTAFDTRLILISGRKNSPEGIADQAMIDNPRTRHLLKVEFDFNTLFERVINSSLEHFIKLSAQRNENKKRFRINDRVSFVATGGFAQNGIVTGYSHPGAYEITTGDRKTVAIIKETSLVPELYACRVEKLGKGYKAFNNLKSWSNRSWTAKFLDGEEITVSRAINNKEAKVAAIKQRLKQIN